MDSDRFVGTWRLVSCIWTAADGSLLYPYGNDPVGYLIYTPDRHMAVNFMSANRRRFQSDDLMGASLQERRAGNKTYQSYSGTYEVRGERVIHHVEVSLFPNWVGTEQERIFHFSGNQLTLSTDPLLLRGTEHRAALVWERVLLPDTADNVMGEAHGKETVTSQHP